MPNQEQSASDEKANPVIPAQAGTQFFPSALGSRLRGNDEVRIETLFSLVPTLRVGMQTSDAPRPSRQALKTQSVQSKRSHAGA